ncbi:MAG: hypothetical protein LKJ94_05790 [Candidatus Methanomethylophilus sp.]|jgi:hypothetical protein|nr:hypothetical protein [Methanomethylophilus sp.]MCI2092534.1 hypothetical protein [Methanomethylophilus sp.]
MLAAAARALAPASVLLLAAAVTWETLHLVDWCITLAEQHGSGTLAEYLRVHAYTYMSFVFGDEPFGWTMER